MRENSLDDICRRVAATFRNQRYISRLSTSRKNWLGTPVRDVLAKVLSFLESL